MEHIVNQDGSIARTSYTINEVTYQLIGTTSTGFKAMDCLDIIKNTKTGAFKEVPRLTLFMYTRKKENNDYYKNYEAV